MNYVSHIFDCDGVLLDSNGAKARGFYAAAMPYGHEAATALVELHKHAGSITRRQRLERFYKEILQVEPFADEFEELLARCNSEIAFELQHAELVPGVLAYLQSIDGTRICVSGVETAELDRVLVDHDLVGYFHGIYGGPERKSAIIRRLFAADLIQQPAVYYGDTDDDRLQSFEAEVDFVWVWGCSDEADLARAYKPRIENFEGVVSWQPA